MYYSQEWRIHGDHLVRIISTDWSPSVPIFIILLQAPGLTHKPDSFPPLQTCVWVSSVQCFVSSRYFNILLKHNRWPVSPTGQGLLSRNYFWLLLTPSWLLPPRSSVWWNLIHCLSRSQFLSAGSESLERKCRCGNVYNSMIRKETVWGSIDLSS